MRALLVIDVDHGSGWDFIGGNNGRERVAFAIKEELNNWRQRHDLVIFIILVDSSAGIKRKSQVVNSKGKKQTCLVCDLPKQYRLASFLEHKHGKQYEPAFIKNGSDAFTNPQLISFLRSKKVTEIVLAGCSTFACVQHTAKGAAKNGINVTLLENCVHPPFFSEPERMYWISNIRGVNPNIIVEII